ncbi:polycystic kidney disease protein 1-like 2 isoform X2 [Patella vulgata]|uniref:polycystic kidney disease protein 1-like 2 isoform X2 n=1 Tax=Patella vulgata TaxID=6465 RepID=UPI0024A964A2|nr:polycystic kidney disease protein 1-like 2 isoform X2 [Patella vulgata]
MVALEDVHGLDVNTTYRMSDISEAYSVGHGDNKNIFPLEREVRFMSDLSSGNDVKYNWDFGDGTFVETTEISHDHLFTSPGAYTIKLNASNALFFDLVIFELISQQTVLVHTLTNNGPTQTYMDVAFTLTLGRPGTASCYVWNMGDGNFPTVYGGQNCAQREDLSQSYYVEWVPEKVLIHKYMFRANETFTVTVTGFNEVSEGILEDFAVITGVGCSYPKVHIIGGGQQIDRPVEHTRSDWISLESNVDISCKVSQEADYKWIVQRLEHGASFLDFILVPYSAEVLSAGLFKILFPPRVFIDGQYKISLNVSMRGIPGLFAIHFTYLKIHQTDLIVKIHGGNARAVGFDTNFRVDALEETYDPDAFDRNNKSSFSFSWSCRRSNESLPAERIYIEIPEELDVNDTLTDGGCFGTGVGWLNTTEAVLELDSRLLQLYSENYFEVEATNNGRVSRFLQSVTIVEGDPPEFILTCLDNCKSKMNPSGEFTVTSSCPACHPLDVINHKWSLFVLKNATQVWEPVSNILDMLHTDVTGAGISFKSHQLIGGLTYRLRLDAKVYGFVASFTMYEFKTNLPPYGGTCSINPKMGYALQTKFIISCEGWLNPGEEETAGAGLLYRFWSSTADGGDVQLLYYGTDPYTPESQFPLGPAKDNYMFDLSVRISNPIGEYVENKQLVQVLVPPTNRDVATYKNITTGESSELTNLFSSGREQEAKQLIVAVASLLNDPSAKLGGIPYVTTQGPTFRTTEFGETTPDGQTTISPYQTTELPEEIRRKIEENRKKRVELRTNLAITLSSTESLTMDSLQQTALAYKVITQETGELSDECQEVTVSAMNNMAATFESIVNEERSDSAEQELIAAEDIVASLANVILSVTNVVNGATTGDYSSNSNTGTTQSTNYGTTTDSGRSTTKAQEIARQITRQALELAENVVKTVLRKRAPGGPPLILKNQMFTIVADRREAAALNNTVISADGGSFRLPAVDVLLDNTSSAFIDTKFITSMLNPFVWDVSADNINSPVLTMNLYDADGDEIPVANLTTAIAIDIDVSGNDYKGAEIFPVLSKDETMYYHTLLLNESTNKALQVILRPHASNVTLQVYVRKNYYPTEYEYDLVESLPKDIDLESDPDIDEDLLEEMRYTIFLPWEEPTENDTQVTYIGVKDFSNQSSIVDDYSDYYDYNGEEEDVIIMSNYTFKIVTSDCRYWSKENEEWLTDGCQVSPLSNVNFTRCMCTHLTSFGSGIFVPPNQISFNTVFNNLGAKLADNNAVLITLCVIIFLYFVGTIWARRKDRQDVEKWGVAPLADNIIGDKYFYQITVHTGMRGSAGTRSKVSFVLSGDDGDTGVRQLIDEKAKKVFNRASVNQYIMGTSECLGPLSYLRVWHDNSGKNKHQGWYLSKIIVTDLQTNQSYFFLCNRWLAVEEDDGMIDRILPVAGNSDVTNFNHLFFSETKKNFTDSHLWISIFARPSRSHFTRVQRVACILSLVFTTMMADAMFYKVDENMDNKLSFKLGPFVFSAHEFYISFICSFVVLPANIIIDQLFRRSRPRHKKIDNAFIKPSQKSSNLPKVIPPLNEDKDKQKSEEQVAEIRELDDILNSEELRPTTSASMDDFWEPRDVQNRRGPSPVYPRCESRSNSRAETRCESRSEDNSEKKSKRKKKQKQKKMLPFWGAYIAWILVFLTSGVSAFITFTYSMEWGKTKSIGWLSSMLLSIGESVTLIQPMKILVLAAIVAWLFKKPELDDVIDDKDFIKPLTDEEITEKAPTAVTRPRLPAPMLNSESLVLARERRLKEIRMFGVIREIVFYVFYLILLVMVSVHNRDVRSYQAKESVLWQINSRGTIFKARTMTDFWKWTRAELIPTLYISNTFNGDPITFSGDKRMISNMAAYRVGPVRLRQHRIEKRKCKLPFQLRKSRILCNGEWGWSTQDLKAYREGWKAVGVNESVDGLVNYPWKYRTDSETKGAPHAGKIGVYPSGGYIADLIGDARRVHKIVDGLEKDNWLDKYTRSVFVEFTLYNPNVNLFTMATVALEVPPTGTFVGEIVVKTFRLFSYLGGYGVVVAVCDALALVFILYFAVRLLKRIRKERRSFFKEFWNGIEFINLLMSITCVVMYVGRHLLTTKASDTVKRLRDAFYNFQRMALWDELFSILVAFVIFASVIKLLHIFRFNRRMSMLGLTIMAAAKELSAFSFCFAIWIIAFMAFSYLTFGPNIESYRSVLTTFESLLSFALGNYEYEALSSVNRILGPMFFFSYVLFIVFILLNMFVTIMNDSFAVVRSKLSEQANQYELVSFITTRFKTWLIMDVARFFKNVRKKYSSGSYATDDDVQDSNASDTLRNLDFNIRNRNIVTPWNTGVNYPGPDIKFVNGFTDAQEDDIVNFYFPDFSRLLPLFSEDPGIRLQSKEDGMRAAKDALKVNPKADAIARAKGALKIDN